MAGHLLGAQLATVSRCKWMRPPASQARPVQGHLTLLGSDSNQPRALEAHAAARSSRAPACQAQTPVGREGLLPAGAGSDLQYQPQSMARGEEEGHGLLNIGRGPREPRLFCWIRYLKALSRGEELSHCLLGIPAARQQTTPLQESPPSWGAFSLPLLC